MSNATLRMEAVALVGTRTYEYGEFTGGDGRTVPGGRKCFVFINDPNELGEPTQVTVSPETFAQLREDGFGTLLTIEAQPFAKGNKVEWRAQAVIYAETGEVLRVAS